MELAASQRVFPLQDRLPSVEQVVDARELVTLLVDEQDGYFLCAEIANGAINRWRVFSSSGTELFVRLTNEVVYDLSNIRAAAERVRSGDRSAEVEASGDGIAIPAMNASFIRASGDNGEQICWKW